MAKTLELQFVTEAGGTARISIDNPKEPVDPVAVKAAMQVILTANAFSSSTGNYVSIKGARVIERNVTDYELV